jgi:hypothetical protein
VEISRDLVITAEPKESLNNLVVGQTAKFTAKASGCSISWEGAVEGSGGTISFTPAGSGFHTIIAKASAGGIEMVRTLSINAVPLAVELERVEPSTGSVQVSSPVKLQAKLPENVGTGKKLTYHWYSYSNATFESDYTDTPETTVRFWEARTCNVFVEVFAQARDGLDQISQSDQLKIDVTKPELKVTMDPQQPMVGQPLTLKVEAPNTTTGLMFRWELPEQLSETGESINRDTLEVIPTTAGEVVVKLIAEENKYYAEVAAIDVPVNITEYSVVASTDTLGPKPMVWDQTKGLVEEVPEISVFQYMTLKAELQPNTGREPVKYVWKLNEDSHFAFMDEGSEVTAYRSQTGECLATVTAYDKVGIELGRGSTSFNVTVSQDRILEAKTKTDDNIKSQDALPDSLHASAESGNNANGNKNTDTTTNPSAIAPKTADKKDKPGDIAVDAKRDSQAWIDALKLIAEHKEAAKNKKRLSVELLWNKIEKTCKDESALKQKVEYKQAETLTVNVLAEYETWIDDTKSKAESLITAGKSAEAAAFLTEAAKRELLADDKEAIQELLDKIKG